MQSQTIKLEKEEVKQALIRDIFRGFKSIPEDFEFDESYLDTNMGLEFIYGMAWERFDRRPPEKITDHEMWKGHDSGDYYVRIYYR